MDEVEQHRKIANFRRYVSGLFLEPQRLAAYAEADAPAMYERLVSCERVLGSDLHYGKQEYENILALSILIMELEQVEPKDPDIEVEIRTSVTNVTRDMVKLYERLIRSGRKGDV